jgi:hypothetical protein
VNYGRLLVGGGVRGRERRCPLPNGRHPYLGAHAMSGPPLVGAGVHGLAAAMMTDWTVENRPREPHQGFEPFGLGLEVGGLTAKN